MLNRNKASYTIPTQDSTESNALTTSSRFLHRLKMMFNRRVQLVLLIMSVGLFVLFNVVDNQQCDGVSCGGQEATDQRNARELGRSQVQHVSDELEDVNEIKEILSHILIARVPGTSGHASVRDYITNYMHTLGWSVEHDRFKSRIPLKINGSNSMNFTNIIAELNPQAKRFLSFACHYDSKLMDDFVGAIDSAVPCAMMLNMAKVLDKYLREKQNNELSLQFIFFDGEEAFVNWNAADSIYGARHLAAKWEQENKLKNIDVMVLLDLLGTRNPQFLNYFNQTEQLYEHMVFTEARLHSLGAFKEYGSSNTRRQPAYFHPYSNPLFYTIRIEDDHIPFLNRNVPILHLIPHQFPDVWHTPKDNYECIHFPTVANLNKILGIFCLEYLLL